ncbi:fungal-specific transcription factor domain-containing protein [Podospora australis]|uniref:Fungal-specific transcription factor domain-containing protein n=1 Tax=Podospora australis TaxID=1536484 RepID=A0AAN6WVY5_9PEZI|nr:fungal-specific transcription factor domain-containing protein [Podospora australis]
MPPKRKSTAVTTDASDTANTGTSNDGTQSNTLPAAELKSAPVSAKRQRVSRACDQCRAAREKCDGVQPQCLPCVTQNRPCTYEVNPKKRGVQTGYIRTLELALGWVFDHVPDSESILSAALNQRGSRAVITGKDTDGADRLHKRWRDSRVHKGIDHALTGGSALPLSPDEHSPSAHVMVKENEPVRRGPKPTSTEPDRAVASPELPTSRSASVSVTPGDGLPTTEPSREMPPSYAYESPLPSSPLTRRLPVNYWRLLDIYFSYTHSWLPILEKQEIFQASYLYSEDGLVLTLADSSSAVHAELWSALALASFQDAASSKSQLNETPSSSHSPGDIYQVARGLIPSEEGPFQIHHARALLLLSLINLGQGNPASASLLIGFAIRVALTFTSPPSTSTTYNKESQRTHSVLAGCFMLETILAVRHNRLPHLRAEDLSGLPSISEDGLDQWEPWTPCEGFGDNHGGPRSSRSPAFSFSTFNQLYSMLSVVAGEGVAGRRGPSSRSQATSFITRLQQAVSRKLPFGALFAATSSITSPVPTAYILRIMYLWVSILANQQAESLVSLLGETLKQFRAQFGLCSLPPFIPICLAALLNNDGQSSLGASQQQQLKELVSDYSSIWGDGYRVSMTPIPVANATPSSIHSDVLGSAHSSQYTHPADNIVSISGLAGAPFYSSSPIPSQQLQAHHLQPNMLNSPYDSFPGYAQQQHRYFAHSSGQSLPPDPGYGRSNMGPAHQGPHTMPPPPTQPGFGGMTDYDALLDDLTGPMEGSDQIDVDPNFMTNLGFAPGCDMSEIFTRDFGGG